MPSDFDIEYEKRRGYSGATNEFIKSGISPELQGIIDKVTGMSASPGRKLEAMRDVMGVVGGIERQRMQETGAGARLGMTEAGAMKRTGITEAGATERNRLTAGIEERKVGALTAPMPTYMQKTLTGAGMGAAPTAKSDWWNEYQNITDYFK